MYLAAMSMCYARYLVVAKEGKCNREEMSQGSYILCMLFDSRNEVAPLTTEVQGKGQWNHRQLLGDGPSMIRTAWDGATMETDTTEEKRKVAMPSLSTVFFSPGCYASDSAKSAFGSCMQSLCTVHSIRTPTSHGNTREAYTCS